MANPFARFRHLSVKRLLGKGTRSVAGQVLVFQVALVVLLVACGVIALILQSERDNSAEARRRSTAVAQTFAHSPGVLAALQTPDPGKILQPLTEAARRAADVDFIVVMDTEGIRYTHPLPDRIGKRFVGEIGPPLAGKAYVESVDGPLGREVQATVPIENADSRVVALVSAGMKVKNVESQLSRQLPIILGAGAGALVLSTGVTALVGKRLRRQTHSLAPDEMTLMYEHHDTVLHSCWSCPSTSGGSSSRNCRASIPRRRRCSPPGARPPTRCTSRASGCSRSTNGPRISREAPRERW
jgi:sensor histidine kinase regulating citrate/malate metabolism